MLCSGRSRIGQPMAQQLCAGPQHHAIITQKGLPWATLPKPQSASHLAARQCPAPQFLRHAPFTTQQPSHVTAAAGAAAIDATATAAASVPASSAAMKLFAALLGYGVLVGSCFRSIPQIWKIIQAGTAEGLSLTSNLMELACYTVIIAYNIKLGYVFNSYGEIFACWLQDLLLVGLIVRHLRTAPALVIPATLAFAASCVWLLSPSCPMNVLSGLQFSTIFVMAIGARLPQIWLNIKRGDASMLSVTTGGLNVIGNLIRTFTTIILTGDFIILVSCVTQLILNGILLWQSIVMRKPGAAGAAVSMDEAPGNVELQSAGEDGAVLDAGAADVAAVQALRPA